MATNTGFLGSRGNSFEEYTKTYTTFSGADIVAVFNGTVIGTLAGITWSVTREKAPIFTMGSPNPRSFSRGKRGIAGSMIFMTFDRPALYNLIQANVSNDEFKIWTRSWNLLPNMNSNIAAGMVPVHQLLHRLHLFYLTMLTKFLHLILLYHLPMNMDRLLLSQSMALSF